MSQSARGSANGRADVPLHLSLGLLAHPSAANWVSAYLTFMKDERKLAFSSMANYLSSLYSLATFVFDSDDFDVPDAVADAQHTVLTACVNLRSQCEALGQTLPVAVPELGSCAS